MPKRLQKNPAHTQEIGLDEAGRGCLAGPLVAAAAFLPKGFDTSGVRDSKLLTARQREQVFERIMTANADGGALIGIGFVSYGNEQSCNCNFGLLLCLVVDNSQTFHYLVA